MEELFELADKIKEFRKNKNYNYEFHVARDKLKELVRQRLEKVISPYFPEYHVRLEGDIDFNRKLYSDNDSPVELRFSLRITHIFSGEGKYQWINKMRIGLPFNIKQITARTDPKLLEYGEVVNYLLLVELAKIRGTFTERYG